MVYEAQLRRLTPQPDIFRHRHIRHQVEFLVNHGNARMQRLQRVAEGHRLAFYFNGAFIGVINTD
ncbi:hypothetical protein D3C72_2520500 [compost metagenome]